MKKLYFFVATIMATAISAQNIEFTNVNFKKNLLEPGLIPTIQDLDGNNTTIDTNGDGEISLTEAKNISVLRFSDVNFTDVNGLEYFTNLKNLMLANVRVREIDLSPFPDLEELRLQINRLSEIDLSNNTKLKFINLGQNFNLKSIDLSKNTELKEFFSRNGSLTQLDLSQNLKIELIACGANKISTLDLSKNTEIHYLGCGKNNLTNIDLSKNTKLVSLDISINAISTIDLSKNTKLQAINLHSTTIKTLDLSLNPNLIGYVTQSPVKCDNNTELETLIIKNTHLENIDELEFKDCPKLKYICADTDEIAVLKTKADGYGYTDLTIDDKCGTDLSNDEFPFNQEFRLYPNPVQNQLQIQAKNGVAIKSITIFNPQGQNVIQTNETTIDVKSLNAGIYIVTILTNKGITKTKFVKL